MKRIGFVINAPLKYSETFLLREFRLLEESGYEVLVFEGYSQEPKNYPYQRIQSLPLNLNSGSAWYYSLKLLWSLFFLNGTTAIRFIVNEIHSGTSIGRALKRIWFSAHILSHKVDYLHFCFADVAIQKELAAKSIHARMSVSLRGSDIVVFPQKHPGCYNRLWNYTDRIHAVSQWIYEMALSIGLDKRQSVSVIHDGVDPERIAFNDSDIHTPLRVLSIGRLEPVKDHLFALEVIKQLIRNHVSLTYTIIGEGSMRPALANRIKELQLEQVVKLNGKERHDTLLKQLNQFDLLLHTSVSEGLGVSLLEAQAAGLLVVSLDSGGTNESIEDGKSGWMVRTRVSEEMVRTVEQILQLKVSERLAVKRQARQRIEDHFTMKTHQTLWIDFFPADDLNIAQ